MEAVALFAEKPSPQAIAAFHFSEEIEARIETLLDKNGEDKLSKADEIELTRLSQFEGQLQLIKARARVLPTAAAE